MPRKRGTSGEEDFYLPNASSGAGLEPESKKLRRERSALGLLVL